MFQKLASNAPPISGFSEEGRLLRLILSLCGVSAPVATQALGSAPKTRYLANKCLAEIDKSYWSMIEEKKEQAQERMKKLCKAHETLKSLYLSSYLTDDSDSIRALISKREESLKKNKEELLVMQQNRAAMSKVVYLHSLCIIIR